MIAVKTGGLTRQVVDHRDGTENGVAIDVDCKTLVGSQQVPYIYEDYCKNDTVASAIMKLYDMSPSERIKLSKKCLKYANTQFSLQETIEKWDMTMQDLCDTWKEKYQRWECSSY